MDLDVGIALGHRRLAIIDLSPNGHQPMTSASRRYVIAFNGEIYNFTDLSAQLEKLGHQFRGHSDTEVMLAAFEEWGIEESLRRFAGMFAFALWDRQDRILHLARDRLGEKPLYYGWLRNSFVFGSELKAMRPSPHWHGEIDRDAVALLMRYGYVPTPFSIYSGVYKLPPACVLSLSLDKLGDAGAFSPTPSEDRLHTVSPKRYWDLYQIACDGLSNPLTSATEAIDTLDDLLHQSVRRQIVSDVPIGAFLSGGIDSSLVAAIMQDVSDRPIRTFTIGFHERDYNEAEFAKRVAVHLGTDHTELYVSAQDALDVIPLLPSMYDEPFADPSQIPTYLVSKMAREHVTVCLSGDGGDEFFAGYNRYLSTDQIWKKLRYFPLWLRKGVAQLLKAAPPSTWSAVLSGIERHLLRRSHPHPNSGAKLHKLADIMGQSQLTDVYRQLLSFWDNPEQLVVNSHEPQSHVGSPHSELPTGTEFIHQAMYWDQISYLLDDNLTKVDRASMAVGLETRLPLLDHKVVEFSWRLPLSIRVHGQQSKWPLRQLLQQYVPKDLVERPKMGFSVPIGDWLRGPLREWGMDYLNPARLRADGFLDPATIDAAWQLHMSGKVNSEIQLWAAIMFSAWYEQATA